MAKIEITKTELVWPGKYNEDGTRREVERVSLPFQIIETINESRATREAKGRQPTLFDVWEGKEGETFEEGWKNKLIWGDNLLVMSSLLDKFAGKIDLIYIDPPFATGADFTFTTELGDGALEVTKEQSVIEEKAYRDTWGKYGPSRELESYLDMIHPRLRLMRDLLADDGSIFVHIGCNVSHFIKLLMDECFGAVNYRNEIVLPGRATKNLQQQFDTIQRLQIRHDVLLWYSRTEEARFKPYWIEKHDVGNPEGHWHHFWSTADRPTMRYELFGITPASGQWVWKKERALQAAANYERFLKEAGGRTLAQYWRDTGCRLEFVRPDPVDRKPQYWRAPAESRMADTMWAGIPVYSNDHKYPTEKNPVLLTEIFNLASNEGDLVADFFCGSGTTLAVAEKLGRRYIGCDLSRWAIHVTRKRLLGIEGCKPFEVLNLGKYERKYWQGVTFGDRKRTDHELAIFQYIAFILKLYGAEPLAGMQHLHGKKGKAVVHVGAVDAPVTIDEINACIEECLAVRQSELHVLGWEWEMGLANLMVEEAKRRGVKLLLLNIPREVMEQQAVEKGDIRFFEVAHLEVGIRQEKGWKVTVTLKDFAFPYADLIPEDVRSKIKKWSDYIDYWAVDWNFQNDTFMNGWVAYRTRKNRTLPLQSDPHTYEKPGTYTIMVKVIDIFGNDTSQAFEVEVS